MQIKDLEKKRYIVNNGLDKIFNSWRRADWINYNTGEITQGLQYENIIETFDKDTKRVCYNLNNSNWKRKNRVQSKIEKMLLSSDCVFVTLTFRDDVFDNTSQETRHRYVTRFLKSQYKEYVANLDYGKKNGREHYHAVIIGRIEPKSWTYGAVNVKKIRSSNDFVAISKYIAKLTYHAIKSSTTCKRIIYSRNT